MRREIGVSAWMIFELFSLHDQRYHVYIAPCLAWKNLGRLTLTISSWLKNRPSFDTLLG
jgi:hypothetical protein